MKHIFVPQTVEEYKRDVLKRAFPEPLITNNKFYNQLINWVMEHRTPLLYNQDHASEYANFSINFNWLLLRDYKDTTLGPPATILAMYALHEFTHMTYWLPTRLNELTAGEYAEEFTESEYRASNETEILLHYRIPELRGKVLQQQKIMFDLLKEKGVTQPSMIRLCHLRPILIEDTILDGLFGKGGKELINELKRFNGNQEWATARFEVIKPFFSHPSLPLGYGLTHTEYETAIQEYEPNFTQEKYEQNIIRNVRLGFAMCGQEIPKIATLEEARKQVKRLEGQHAIVQN
jgi:hypothetical protein